jgi:hypothetical protein
MPLAMNGRAWIPIAVTILGQTVGIIWWASSLAAKVAELSLETERQKLVIAENSDRLTKVQTIQQQLLHYYEPHYQNRPK